MPVSNITFLTAHARQQSGHFTALSTSDRCHWFSALTLSISKLFRLPSQSNSTPKTNHKINYLLSIANAFDTLQEVKATKITASTLNLVHCQFERVCGLLPKN